MAVGTGVGLGVGGGVAVVVLVAAVILVVADDVGAAAFVAGVEVIELTRCFGPADVRQTHCGAASTVLLKAALLTHRRGTLHSCNLKYPHLGNELFVSW